MTDIHGIMNVFETENMLMRASETIHEAEKLLERKMRLEDEMMPLIMIEQAFRRLGECQTEEDKFKCIKYLDDRINLYHIKEKVTEYGKERY